MGNENLSVYLHRARDLRLATAPEPEALGDHEVLLSTHYVGICGSDIAIWADGHLREVRLDAPLIIGHEASGHVIQVGSAVEHLSVGDRVAVEPIIPCLRCKFCRTGKYNVCPRAGYPATPPVNGFFTRRFKHPAMFCYKLPDNVSSQEGAIMEPLSVAVHCSRRANVSVHSRVLICGAGSIGMLNLVTTLAYGASRVCITDVKENKLDLARALGAHSTVLIERNDSTEVMVKKVRDAMGCQPDIVIECCGLESSIGLALTVVESAGLVLLVGHDQKPLANAPLSQAAVREVDIKGVMQYPNCFPISINMVSTGRINVKPLISKVFPMTDTTQAFLEAKNSMGIKLMVDCRESS